MGTWHCNMCFMGKSCGTLAACSSIAPILALALASADCLCRCACVCICVCMGWIQVSRWLHDCFHCICTCVALVFAPALNLHSHWHCHSRLLCSHVCTWVAPVLNARMLCPIRISEGDFEESAFALAPACCGVRGHMLLVAIDCSCTCAAAVVLLLRLHLHVCEFVNAWHQQSFMRSVLNSYAMLSTQIMATL